MADPGPLTILVAGDDGRVVAAVSARFPAAQVRSISRDMMRNLPVASALLVADRAHARIARATGFPGGIVILATPADDDERSAFLEQGSHFVGPAIDGDAIAVGVAAAVPLSVDGSPEVVEPRTLRLWRLIAAGEVACALQHAINNPLTALMTEVQMLQIESPCPETRATAGRMLEQVRRVAELTRSLDAVRDRPFRI